MHDATQLNSMRTEQREATLLFADLRGSTELTSSLETHPLACELLAHVIECLSDAIAAQDGFIVDYFGDGLMAMWNAPAEQPDHPNQACRAALQMLESLPTVTAEWLNVTNTRLRLGIGVHTAVVQVGNAGSTRKRKYGPRGPNVNLASRVEAATKELGVPFLATRATADRLTDQFARNRVCNAQMPGLPEDIALYSVSPQTSHVATNLAWEMYDDALQCFERKELDKAADKLRSIDESLSDIPTRFLYERVQNERGRALRRRNSDVAIALPNGVIQLVAK